MVQRVLSLRQEYRQCSAEQIAEFTSIVEGVTK
jgi:hypothetical protein